ncbi:MAG: histidine kinase N-terminal 7TM domain-containing protein [Candidatus Thermoplasmatota archaeon]|nr:histidine kinase N-terminal 7TM domain-containing protein [Candidatus Thermoplasmatota archaeon]
MNVYAILPLISLFSNLILCFYVFHIDPKNRLNQLFGLFTLSLAIWSFGHLLMFTASSTAEAMIWKNIATFGSIFTVIVLFHFSIVFTKNKYASTAFLLAPFYLFGCFLVFIDSSTTLLTESMKISYWGVSRNTAALYPVLSLSIVFFTLTSIILYFKFYLKSSSNNTKNQSKFLIIGLLFPFVGGIITQVIAPMTGFEIIPIAPSLTTIFSFFIVFSIFRYSFVRPMSFSIQKKIVTMFFVLLFCMIFFTLSSVNYFSRNAVAESTSDNLNTIAHSKANHIDTIINRDMERLILISSRTQLHIRLERFNDNSNEEDKNFIKNILYDANQSIDDYKDIFIINTSGKGIVSTNPIYINISYSNQEYYIKGKTENGFFLILDDDIPKIYISGPLILNETVLGIIVVISNPDTLFNTLSDSPGLGETGESYLVNESGFVLSPLRDYNYSYNMDHIILRKKIDTENYHNYMLQATYSDEELGKKHGQIKIFENYRGEKVLGTHVYISEMNWGLLVEIDEQEAFYAVNNMQNIVSIILSLSGFIVLFVAFFYAKTFSDPIRKLDTYAKEISQGNLNIRADIKTSDEIGSLASSFNNMAENLKLQTSGLERKVDERTSDLQEKIEELEEFKRLVVGRELRMIELKKQIKRLEDDHKIDGGNRFD